MTTRDRTSEFEGYKRKEDDVELGMLKRPKECGWSGKLDEVVIIRKTIEQKLEQLKDANSKINTSVNFDGDKDTTTSRDLSKEIVELMRNAKRVMGEVEGNVGKRERMVMETAKKLEMGRFQHLAKDFGLVEKHYVEEEERQIALLGHAHLLMDGELESALVEERARMIKDLVGDLVDLRTLFADVQTLVHEQGHMIDRIDYNIEQAQDHVESGNQNLVAASKSQTKSRKCFFAIITIVFLFLLIIGLVLGLKH